MPHSPQKSSDRKAEGVSSLRKNLQVLGLVSLCYLTFSTDTQLALPSRQQ